MKLDLQHFDEVVAQMPDLLRQLQAAPKHRVADHPEVPNAPGIYLFSEDARPVYVGQSRKLRSRLLQHVGVKNDHNQASFAFNVARRDAKLAGIDVKRWRKVLVADPKFATHFAAARAKVAAMDVQYISVPDPSRGRCLRCTPHWPWTPPSSTPSKHTERRTPMAFGPLVGHAAQR